MTVKWKSNNKLIYASTWYSLNNEWVYACVQSVSLRRWTCVCVLLCYQFSVRVCVRVPMCVCVCVYVSAEEDWRKHSCVPSLSELWVSKTSMTEVSLLTKHVLTYYGPFRCNKKLSIARWCFTANQTNMYSFKNEAIREFIKAERYE